MILYLQVSTFWRSCADARHFYGTVRDRQNKVKLEVLRQSSRSAVIKQARLGLKKHYSGQRYRLVIAARTAHF